MGGSMAHLAVASVLDPVCLHYNVWREDVGKLLLHRLRALGDTSKPQLHKSCRQVQQLLLAFTKLGGLLCAGCCDVGCQGVGATYCQAGALWNG